MHDAAFLWDQCVCVCVCVCLCVCVCMCVDIHLYGHVYKQDASLSLDIRPTMLKELLAVSLYNLDLNLNLNGNNHVNFVVVVLVDGSAEHYFNIT